jgi:hypothetical protein
MVLQKEQQRGAQQRDENSADVHRLHSNDSSVAMVQFR